MPSARTCSCAKPAVAGPRSAIGWCRSLRPLRNSEEQYHYLFCQQAASWAALETNELVVPPVRQPKRVSSQAARIAIVTASAVSQSPKSLQKPNPDVRSLRCALCGLQTWSRHQLHAPQCGYASVARRGAGWLAAQDGRRPKRGCAPVLGRAVERWEAGDGAAAGLAARCGNMPTPCRRRPDLVSAAH